MGIHLRVESQTESGHVYKVPLSDRLQQRYTPDCPSELT